MKGKASSTHHREQNTYRFQTFSERLAVVNVDVARKVQRLAATPEDADTFFGESLRKWSELNYTQHFVDFRQDVAGTVFSFAQLIHHQKKIVAALLKHLQVPDSMAYEPLLDLLVQVARDLQSDFYVYFEEILPVLVGLLQIHHHDIKVLEVTFTCLSYLFKFLWRAMVANISHVYRLVSPLLSNQYREYINNFAAESFAFLMRKVKYFPKLCDVMFEDLREHPDQVSGVGRLLFESLKGVQKRLHTASEKMLPVMLEKLGSETLPVDQVCMCLLAMLNSVAVYTAKEHTEPLWTPLLHQLKAIHTQLSESRPTRRRADRAPGGPHAEHLGRLLELLVALIHYKKGLLVLPVTDLTQVLTDLLSGPPLPEHEGELLLRAVSELVMAERVTLTFKHQAALMQLVYASSYSIGHLVAFTRAVLNMAMFEKDVLQPLMVFCTKSLALKGHGEDAAIQLLAELVINKAPPPSHSELLDDYNTYLLDFGSVGAKCPNGKAVPEKLLKKLKSLVQKLDAENLQTIWAIVLCIPHIRPMDTKSCLEVLRQLLDSIADYVQEANDETKDTALCVAADAVLALIQKQDNDWFFATVTPDCIVNLLKHCSENVHALRAAAFYFTHSGTSELTSNKTSDAMSELRLQEIYPFLERNLSSPHPMVRLLTLQICSQFTLTMPTLPHDMGDLDQPGVFRICLQAEMVEVSVQTYRTKLMHLQKLDYDMVQNQLPSGPYTTVALRYLIGQLYINFTLMWDSVIELIRSHAVNLKPAVFWPVYEAHLQGAADLTEAAGFYLDRSSKPKTNKEEEEAEMTLEAVLGRRREAAARPGRPDHFNHRMLLWRTMQVFPEVCEPKSRVIVPLFFRFLDNEFYPANEIMAPTQNVGKKETRDHPEEGEDEDEEDAEVDEAPVKKNRKQKSKQRPYNSILVTHLGVFAKFRGPKSLFGEDRLRELYYELLPHRSPNIQKMAFQCILTYKNKSLLPYKENIEKLMDDKTFKNEIVSFSIDQEANVLDNDHRADVLPVVIAIIYGKMLTKTGKDTSGKGNAHVRRSIVFRFLAGCQQHELRIFFDLIFKPVSHYIKDDIYDMVQRTREETDITKVVPLKKQQSLLTTVELILQKLGALIDTYLPSMLRVLVGIMAQVSHLLEQRNLLSPRAVTLLKVIRTTAITRLNQLFSTYLTYNFTKDEIQMVFSVAVWPQLELLPNDGIHSPKGLLSLFLTWSKHTRYFGLFYKRWSEGDFCVLQTVMTLLKNKSASPKVIEVIMDIVYNLLTKHEEEMEDQEEQAPGEDGEQAMEEPDLDVGDVVELDECNKDFPLGVQILIPHVPIILDHVHKVVDDMLKQKGRSKTLPFRILNVLSRLSEYVTDSSQCGRMLSLLVPFLSRNLNRSVEVELSILRSIQHMIKLTPDPSSYTRTFAKMFSNLSARPSRAALCSTLQSIAECDPSMKPLADIVGRLNAWDARYTEEPDYLVRLEAYREAQTLIHSLEGDAYITPLLVVMHNAVFFISTVVDMSLRDSASHCVQQLMKHLSERPNNSAAVRIVVQDALLPETKTGLKLKSEAARHEYLTLLSHLIKLFPKIPVFADLASLSDDDLEADFFANMVHIQLHRRGRAMRRITRMLGQRRFITETLTGFLLPLVTSYLRDETYLKQAVILDAVVETVGSIAQCLPWPQYQTLLKYYLNQLPLSLDNQKLMVRVIVAVLDSFHYDLRNSEEISSTALKAPGVAKEEEKPIAGLEDVTQKKPIDTDVPAAGGDTETVPGAVEDTAAAAEEEEEGDGDPAPGAAGPPGPTLGAVTVCSPGQATRIHRLLIKVIIPQLHHSLTKKVKSDDEHKKAKSGTFAEDEEVLRVPIALALVKLMQSLPHKTLDFNLPGLLFKLCVFLRSRALDIRNSARDTLLKIMKTLGPSYFSYVLKELRFTLKRGYQLHVLCFTTHTLLKTLENVLSCGDLESSVQSLVEVFNQEIFGPIAEEKNVIEITNKLMEAKSTKSYESYAILSKFIAKGSLSKVFSPLKSILETTTSHKTAAKVEDILHKMIPGMLANTSLELSDLMTFTFGLTTELMPLLTQKKKKNKEPVVVDDRLPPTDTLIVQAPPSRTGVKSKTVLKTNMHILVEFGLQILYSLLKHSTLNQKTLEHAKLLDPFVPILANCLRAKYAKVTSVSLRCFIWVFKFPLPLLKSHIKDISNALFINLKNYAAAGAAASGDNLELIDMCFKTVTVLVRDVDYHTIKTDELKVLLGYAEQDIHDHTRQATAFSILKAILSRKLVVPEMHDVMQKIEELSITAHDPSVRQNCRQVAIKFLLNYPLGDRLEHHLEFYVSQLQYEHDTGRESALEMLANMFEAFPPKLLHKYSGLFFVPLASQLVNDDSAKCRKQTSLAIKQLLNQLETEKRDELFMMITVWFDDDKVALRKLASLTCGVIVEVETTKFERHLTTLLPIVERQLRTDQHSFTESGEERLVDHLLYCVLTLLNKLVRLCNLCRRQKWASQMSVIWGHVEQLMLYPHMWVRLAAAELFGLLLATWAPRELVTLCEKPIVKSPLYLQQNTMEKLHDLCGIFCKQFSSSQLDEALGNQVLKNLVFMGKVVRHFPKAADEVNNTEVQKKKSSKVRDADQENADGSDKRTSFEWLLSRLYREAKTETANSPKDVLKRSCVFKWLAAMALDLGPEGLPPYLPRMLPLLVRELTDKSPNSDAGLQKLGEEVIDLIKKTAGVEMFTSHYALVLKTLVDKRQSRKRDRAAELIADPEIAAKRKLQKNLAKQKAKKRKIEDMRPVKRTKIHKFVDS